MIARVILLAGGLHPSSLARACGVSMFTLPIGAAGEPLLRLWTMFVEASMPANSPATERVLCVNREFEGEAALFATEHAWSVRADLAAYRGPAGVVRDATRDLPPHANVIVAEASRVIRTPVSQLISDHTTQNADATVGVNPDGSPAGVFVFRVAALGRVPEVGFMDLKEQFLPRLSSGGGLVRISRLAPPGSVGFRTRAEFLRATFTDDVPSTSDNHASSMLGRFAASASVDPTAHVVHSVIGPGARVEPGAVVVRSIVTGSAVITAGTAIHDSIVTSGGIFRDTD